MKTILILEDNETRELLLRDAVSQLSTEYAVRVWKTSDSMHAECESFFADTVLISLDHDLDPEPGATTDPGTGMEVARFLGDFLPVCPVIIHSQNMERVWSMFNELRFAGWAVEQAGGMGADWSQAAWLRCAREMLAGHPNTWKSSVPADHSERMERALASLDGLAVGDALGEMLSYRFEHALKRIEDDLPAGPWIHTDDTEMAISVASVLKSHGFIEQNALAKRFARRFERDPDRGYGSMTRTQLREMIAGAKWMETAGNAFRGQGSMGNGSAMRVAPLGAYFADNLERCVEQAGLSSRVTHTHPEGIAGAIAVAVGAATAWQLRNEPQQNYAGKFFAQVLRLTPESEVRRTLVLASQSPGDRSTHSIAKILGNGSLVTAPDTIPFCIWMAANYPRNFAGAIGATISVGGDCDTNAAIVGGIIAAAVGREGIPAKWLRAKEEIQI